MDGSNKLEFSVLNMEEYFSQLTAQQQIADGFNHPVADENSTICGITDGEEEEEEVSSSSGPIRRKKANRHTQNQPVNHGTRGSRCITAEPVVIDAKSVLNIILTTIKISVGTAVDTVISNVERELRDMHCTETQVEAIKLLVPRLGHFRDKKAVNISRDAALRVICIVLQN